MTDEICIAEILYWRTNCNGEKWEASEEAGERNQGLNSHHGSDGREADSSSGHWVEQMDRISRLAGGPWPQSDSGDDALGCPPSGSYSSTPRQPVGMPGLALPVTSRVARTGYLGASLCPLEETGLIPGPPWGAAVRSQGANASPESLDKGPPWRE